MPHQCLKCGCIYADGSPEILKGCSDCQGTRFFYTQEALGDDERSRMTDRADIELESLALGKGLADDPSRSRIPTKDELPVGHGADAEGGEDGDRGVDDEWVRMTPNHLRNIVEDVVRRGSEKKPRFRVGAPVTRPDQTLGEWAGAVPTETAGTTEPASRGRGSDDLIESLLGDAPDEAPGATQATTATKASTATPAGEDAAHEEAEEEVVYARSKRPMPPPLDLEPSKGDGEPDMTPAERMAERVRQEAQAIEPTPDDAPSDDTPDGGTATGRPEPEAPTRYPEGTPPETIAIQGDGAYELDVKRLLEKSPLVVHKDGTYSLHLPSLMEMVDKKPRK